MGKKTYQRVIDLLNDHIPTKVTRNEFCRVTGVNRNSVDRYRAGLGSPTDETLQKLAAYFGVSVAWLRGGPVGPLERFLEGLKETGTDPVTYNKTVADKMGKDCDYWGDLVAGDALSNSEQPAVLCGLFDINSYWVRTGCKPTILDSGGYVGTIDSTEITPDAEDRMLKKMIEWYQGDNPLLADYMAFCLREDPELRKEVEKRLAADSLDSKKEKNRD